ncbi:hypothetical protein HIM_12217 [Hirsutella minnesotensis 3608]|uniref:Uncharacterized protein n=1 Tax=Hirsutella minnesotensis 3608 TaxID=1043627 RepID=A0A0F7ZW57_9HYPO|nr:hypothetical protein HIM_12217 [Hirsutella minnesotensis 3608]
MSDHSREQREAHLQDFNRTDDATTLHNCIPLLFERTVEASTDKTAVICAGVECTYGDLNARANRIARVLVGKGVGRGDLVGVAVGRSIHLIAVLLAVLKSGAAYLPIDPTIPSERIRQMVGDATLRLVVIQGDDAASNAFAASHHLDCDCSRLQDLQGEAHADLDGSNLCLDLRPEDLAYVIYTSGSTGRPKGVEVSHGAASNFLCSMRREPGCTKEDRLLAISTISFDVAVHELFMPLISGATVVVAQSDQTRDPSALLKLMDVHGITTMLATPTLWQMLINAGWRGQPRLRTIVCGGECLSRSLADRLLDYGDAVWNEYGPTETTVCASLWRVQRDKEILIGRPVANARLYVLDSDLSPVALGKPGELYIGGAGLARGYRNNPALTDSVFIRNPFHKGLMYRTGDLASFVAAGELKVHGRSDSQVKIRGHRIELGDIEAAITDHEDISGAAVIKRNGRLVAYCKGESASRSMVQSGTIGQESVAVPGGARKPMLDHILRPWLTQRLPEYMIPAFFVQVSEFSLTHNGKIDLKSLPDPVGSTFGIAVKPATTELESKIMAIWSDVLGHNHIGVDDNFLQIGGDSSRIILVQARLEKLLGRQLLISRLFEHYTIKMLASHLENVTEFKPEPIKTIFPPPSASGNTEDIAIVSMACRLPGGIDTPEDLWQVLATGQHVITKVPKDRWDADAIYDADLNVHGKSYSRSGGFVTLSEPFDGSFFGISPRETRSLDLTQRMMLETCWEGFERAGYTTEKLRGSCTGVYVGTSNSTVDDAFHRGRTLSDLDGYVGTGSAGGTLSGRVSYVLGLEGPALTVDTGCSSSLVTTHLACAALRLGECDMAIAGGVAFNSTPGLHVEFSRLRGISPGDQCKAFAQDAQGTVLAEGAAVVVLKRLSDARRDGDTVHAVIRGSAVNHGGRSSGLTVPNSQAQKRLIQRALAVSGLQPSDIDFVEAHGTGTKLGDPIEGKALSDVFRNSRPTRSEPLWIGSTKSNLGHTQAAAGVVGMIKVIMAMRHETLPQTLHVAKPTPEVDWSGANMALVLEKRGWKRRPGRPRRAGVSAFGIGGTNAHVVLEEASMSEDSDTKTGRETIPRVVPMVLSACTDEALGQQAAKLLSFLENSSAVSDRLGDVAYSLATTRNHFARRQTFMASDGLDLQRVLSEFAEKPTTKHLSSSHGEKPRLAMLFDGQGAQMPGMGRGLAKQFPVFRNALNEIAAFFNRALEKPLLDVMWAEAGSDDAALLQRTDFAQPALLAIEVALWRLWESWGVRPDLVLGHSLGELGAAHVAGVMNLEDACKLVEARGRLMRALSSDGGMVSLGVGADEVARAIEHLGLGRKVDIAGYNTPKQTVVSGDLDAIEGLRAYFSKRDRKSSMLRVSHAFHSHHVSTILADFQRVAETVSFHPPQVDFVSTLTGQLADVDQLKEPGYWVQQARCPVRFSDGIETLLRHGVNVFLEIGPRPLLCGMGKACVPDDANGDSIAWLPSLDSPRDDVVTIQTSLGRLHDRRIPIDWASYFRPFDCRRVELPTYAFRRNRAVANDARTVPVEQSQSPLGDAAPQVAIANDADHQPPRRGRETPAPSSPLTLLPHKSASRAQENGKHVPSVSIIAKNGNQEPASNVLDMVRATAATSLGFHSLASCSLDNSHSFA